MAESTVSRLSLFRIIFRRMMLPVLIPAVTVLLLAGICASAPDKKGGEEFPVRPPPFTPGIFPCSACHEGIGVKHTKERSRRAYEYQASPRPRSHHVVFCVS